MWFSDLRVNTNYEDFKHGVTYFDIDNESVKEIKVAVKYKTKVTLSKNVVEEISNIDLDILDKFIDSYISTLKIYTLKIERKDSFFSA